MRQIKALVETFEILNRNHVVPNQCFGVTSSSNATPNNQIHKCCWIILHNLRTFIQFKFSLNSKREALREPNGYYAVSKLQTTIQITNKITKLHRN